MTQRLVRRALVCLMGLAPLSQCLAQASPCPAIDTLAAGFESFFNAVDSYTWERIAEQTEQSYRKVVRARVSDLEASR